MTMVLTWGMGAKAGQAQEEALVVLGCRIGDGAFQRRVLRAAGVFHAEAPALVVASGGRRWDGRAEADELATRLGRAGVPEERLVRELCSLSTLENAAYSAEILRERGFGRAVVVTCDFHAARAFLCFSWMGLETRVSSARTDAPRRSRPFREWVSRALDHRASSAWVHR